MSPSDEKPFDRLTAIMHKLRAPGGCPWDAEQTHASLRPYLIEEAYELLEALDSGDDDAVRDELGDVLLQVIFHSELAAERGAFTIDDVTSRLVDKLVRRHPHVFADASVTGSEDVKRNWSRIKAAERAAKAPDGKPAGALAGVPAALPALARAHRIGQKAATIGLDWNSAAEVREKIDEELAELDAAVLGGVSADAAEELGDLLLAVASYARHLGLNAETLLRAGLDKFSRRVECIEGELHDEGIDPRDASPERLEMAWERAKRAERSRD
jgi:MazG family protein